MKLQDALLCVESTCNAIFDRADGMRCPYCLSYGALPLERLVNRKPLLTPDQRNVEQEERARVWVERAWKIKTAAVA